MMRTIGEIKIHVPMISWLFVALEIILLCYQLFRFYTLSHERKNWLPVFILLLLLIWNCTIGYLAELPLLVLVNTVALLMTVLLMLLPFLYDYSKKIPNVPENAEEPTDSFIANCRRYNFTARETEIVVLIRKGYKNRQIAEELYISEKTVESHLQHIYDKAGERSKLALITKLNQ